MSKRVRIQSRVTVKGLGSGTMVSERWSSEHIYEGMQVKTTQYHLANTQFIHKDTVIRNGKVKRYIGDTQDVINHDLSTDVRTISCVSGRDKPVSNKKPQGELRRKRVESQTLSFGVSRSKAYHKAKHS